MPTCLNLLSVIGVPMWNFVFVQVVEDGYEFFADRQLVTIFSAPNYCGEFDNAGAMMSVDETLMCSFQILKPAEKKTKFMMSTKIWCQGNLVFATLVKVI